MSRPNRPAGAGGGSEVAAALRDPNVTQLLHVCGRHIDLAVDCALQFSCESDSRFVFMTNRLYEQSSSDWLLWYRPLQRALQSRFADCRCSPFDRLVMRASVVSGSMAERLWNLPRPPKYQTTSDVDVMFELGPVHWTFPGTEKTIPVEVTAAGPATSTTADPGGQDSDPAPRLVIKETENPGFVLVLQERRDDCPHQERRPFKAEDVTQYLSVYQLLAGECREQRSTNGPACSFSLLTNTMAGGVSDYDEVPCLHVPVWWFSDEFFTRHRTCNWPPEAVRDNIRRYGLHLVPVGAPGSATEQLQFRLSFSRAEVVIALHLTKAQRYAVIAFKKCKAALGEEGKVLKSYFVKTALLWLCERTPTEDWTSVTQGVLKLLDYLDKAVSTGKLPCYFWSRINILRFTSRADRKAMKKTLGNIRQHLMRLLVHELCVLYPALREKLTRETRRLSERQLRVCLTRWRIRVGVHNSMTRYMTIFIPDHLNKLLPVLLRSNTQDEVITMLRGLSLYRVQEALYQALIVAPADVASHVRFSASGGGGFVWDAAPLLELLTEDDLKKLLGEPDTVRAWLRRQHQLPETERPASLPADLRSPRDLCDLLLNIPLLICVLKESVPGKWAEIQCKAAEMTLIAPPIIAPLQQARREVLKFSARWSELADDLQHELRMDRQAAVQTACRVGVELRQLCDDPETLAEHRRISHSLPDPWQLRHFVLGSSA